MITLSFHIKQSCHEDIFNYLKTCSNQLELEASTIHKKQHLRYESSKFNLQIEVFVATFKYLIVQYKYR